MKLLNKHFFAGFALGSLFGVFLLIGGSYLALYLTKGRININVKPPVLPMAVEADYDWTLETLSGEPFHLSELKGKVAFLTLWRPGCAYCEAELPFLQDLYDKTRQDDIAFATVAVSNKEGVLDLIVEHDLTFPIYFFDGERPKVYKTGSVPATFILSPSGKIAFRYKGAAKWDDDSSIAFMRSLADGQLDALYGLEEDPKDGG